MLFSVSNHWSVKNETKQNTIRPKTMLVPKIAVHVQAHFTNENRHFAGGVGGSYPVTMQKQIFGQQFKISRQHSNATVAILPTMQKLLSGQNVEKAIQPVMQKLLCHKKIYI